MDGTQMRPPVNPWIMETGSFYLWGILFVLAAIWTARNRRIPLFGLVLIAATSSFWQEFFGDWGAYVAWNPAFSRLPLWGEMPFTTPVKPAFIPASWGWWFAISIPLLTSLVLWLRRRLPGMSPRLLAMLCAFPLFFAYQIYVEGSSVENAWWTYDAVIGPSLDSANGRLPLIFPLLLALWAGWFVGVLATRDEQGFMAHEVRFSVPARAPGRARELTRQWAMIVIFQVSFFAVNIAPAIIGRALFGGPSVLVP